MTPADRALAARIRTATERAPYRVAVSGLDGSGKSTLCAALAEALGLPVVRVPDRARVAARIAAGADPGSAQLRALQAQLIDAPAAAILDRGPLCVAAIHPDMFGLARLLARSQHVATVLLDLPLSEARQRKADPEAELRDREAEARRYRELAARWPRTAVVDASQSPEAVLSAALVAAAWAVGVAP
jgi:adenylate kinase family enzyme